MAHVTILDLNLATLRGAVDASTYARGAEYARQRDVLYAAWDPDGEALRGVVRGQENRVYNTAAFFSVTRGLHADFELGECSCPVEFNCKHVVALVLSAMVPDTPEPARPAGPQPAVWEKSLDSVLSPGGSVISGTTPLAIELALAGGPGQPRWGKTAGHAPLRLIARLVRPGKNGGWVGGDLSWGRLDPLRYSGEYREEQVRLLRELYVLYQAREGRGGYHRYSYGDDRSIEFSAVGSRQLWPLLDEAAAAGLRLVYPGKRGMLAGYGDAEFCLDVTRAADGLRIVPVIRAAGGEPAAPVAFIGAEGHGAVCVDPAEAAGGEPGSWRFRLARLVRPVPPPLQQMALGGESLQVPAAEELRFRDRYYPRLRHAAAVISSDGSFTPPAISGPDLVLRASYRGGHELEVSWEWAYRVGDSLLRAPLEAERPDDGYRDLAAERTLLDGLDLPLDRYGLLGPGDGLPGAAPRALTPRTRLTGIDTMRFTTELLPLLADQPGLILEVSGEPADYREAGDSLQITVSADELAGETDWFDLGVTITVEGHPVPFLEVFLALSRGEPASPAARRGLFLPGQARAAGARPADRGGPGAAGLAARPAADQPVPGRVLGRAGRAGSDRTSGGGVARAGPGPAVSRGREPDRATARAAGPAAAVPAGRVRLAGVLVGAPAGRDPRRRHGTRQDAAVPRPDQPRQAVPIPGRPGGRAVPDRRADQRGGELGRRSGTLRAGPAGGPDTRHRGPARPGSR